MMMNALPLLALAAVLLSGSAVVDAFVAPSAVGVNGGFHAAAIDANRPMTMGTSLLAESKDAAAAVDDGSLKPGDPVLLVGPGFLQLVIAKHMARAGLKPIVVAAQSKLDSFFKTMLKTGDQPDSEETPDMVDPEGIHRQIKEDSTIGMPEVGDPYFGELKGVVFCAEEAVLPTGFVEKVLDFEDQGKSAYADGAPTRVVCCLPLSNKQTKEKSNSWLPVLSGWMDMKGGDMWKQFETTYKAHPSFAQKDGRASIVRFGSLFGGSTDGPPVLMDYGLDEGIYKMSLEQYRDMRERAFDRYKLAGQVLDGDSINPQPDGQEAKEKEVLKKVPSQIREMFSIVGEYPEIDRANRHTIANGIVELMQQPSAINSKEITILSKASSEMSTSEAWKEMFANPGPASWPDPNDFDPAKYGLSMEESK